MSDGDASNSSNQTQAEARKTANVESVLAQQPAASTEKTTIANPGNTSSSPSSQNATTTTSPATPTTTLREDLIKSAVSFLSSPNVRSAETAKKVAFLRQKGLSQEEIEEAFKRVGDSTSMTATVQVCIVLVSWGRKLFVRSNNVFKAITAFFSCGGRSTTSGCTAATCSHVSSTTTTTASCLLQPTTSTGYAPTKNHCNGIYLGIRRCWHNSSHIEGHQGKNV